MMYSTAEEKELARKATLAAMELGLTLQEYLLLRILMQTEENAEIYEAWQAQA